jgi:hypothetical protein
MLTRERIRKAQSSEKSLWAGGRVLLILTHSEEIRFGTNNETSAL